MLAAIGSGGGHPSDTRGTRQRRNAGYEGGRKGGRVTLRACQSGRISTNAGNGGGGVSVEILDVEEGATVQMTDTRESLSRSFDLPLSLFLPLPLSLPLPSEGGTTFRK